METCRYKATDVADTHTCRDRDGKPITGTDKVCFAEARSQIRDEANAR